MLRTYFLRWPMYVSFALIYWLTLSLSLCLNVRQKLGTKNTQYSLSLSVSLTHSLTHLIIHSPTHMTYDLMTYDRLNMSDLVLTEHVWSCSGWENLLQRRRTKRISMGLDVCKCHIGQLDATLDLQHSKLPYKNSSPHKVGVAQKAMTT